MSPCNAWRRYMFVGVLVLLFLVAAVSAYAIVPNPAQGTAVINGDAGEWQVFPMDSGNPDFFASMFRAANSSKDVLSQLYMRQECLTSGDVRMYGLVIPFGQAQGIVESVNDSFVKITADGIDPINGTKYVSGADSPTNGTQPEWAWGQSAGSGLRTLAEFSFDIHPGMYQLNVHVNILDGSGSQTSAVQDRNVDFTATCPPGTVPTPVLPTVTNTPMPPATPTPKPTGVPTLPPNVELSISKVVLPSNQAEQSVFTLTLGIGAVTETLHISAGETITKWVPISTTISLTETQIPIPYELVGIECPMGPCSGFMITGPTHLIVTNKVKATNEPEVDEPKRRIYLPVVAR